MSEPSRTPEKTPSVTEQTLTPSSPTSLPEEKKELREAFPMDLIVKAMLDLGKIGRGEIKLEGEVP